MNKIIANIVHNPKTTLTGLVCGLALALSAIGILPTETAQMILYFAGGTGAAALVAHANDPKKTE